MNTRSKFTIDLMNAAMFWPKAISEPELAHSVVFSEFVFDIASGDLYRNGRLIKLPAQTTRLLAYFVENPQVVLTRDDIRLRLWPDGSFIDYDQSINRAISQLRYALRDSSYKSKNSVEGYIETLPKRGYRFIAPVAKNEPVATITVDDSASVPHARRKNDLRLKPAHALASEVTATEDSLALSTYAALLLEESEPSNSSRPRLLQGLRVWWLLAVGLFLCIAGAIAFAVHSHPTTSPKVLAIGILPFESTGTDATALAESFRLDLADSLAQIPKIRISALNSFDGMGTDAEKTKTRALQLQIDVLLTGHLTVSGDECQIQLEMLRVRDGSHLLSLQYKGKRAELASIRDRIEADIFQRLKSSTQSDPLVLQKTSSPAAYDSYLKGRSELSEGTSETLRLSAQSFEKAIKEDPAYARAYAGAADVYFLLSQRSAVEKGLYVEKARQFASKSTSLDPGLAEAHEVLGKIAMMDDWNLAEAHGQFRRAIELAPYDASYHQPLAALSAFEGDYATALNEIGKARAAEPDRNTFFFTEIYIDIRFHRFDRAEAVFSELLQKMPNWGLVHEDRGVMLWEMKEYTQAIEEWHHAALLDKNADRAKFEERGLEAFKEGGVVAYARLRLQAIATKKGLSYEEVSFIPAEWYAYAGENDLALQALKVQVDNHASEAWEISTNPAYESLHQDPRFLALTKRVGLPDQAVKGSGSSKQ